jgi:hypothetical protein
MRLLDTRVEFVRVVASLTLNSTTLSERQCTIGRICRSEIALLKSAKPIPHRHEISKPEFQNEASKVENGAGERFCVL